MDVRRLRPRLGLAVILHAAPAALAPYQPRRPAEAGQVPDVHRHALVGLGTGPALTAAHHLGGRLDLDHQLGRRLTHRQDPEAVRSQQRLGQPGTVAHRQGSPVLVAVEQPRRWRDPWLARWALPTSRHPYSDAESVSSTANPKLAIDEKRQRLTNVDPMGECAVQLKPTSVRPS